MSEKKPVPGLWIVGGLILSGIIIAVALKNSQRQQSSQAPAFQTSDLIAILKPHIDSAVESALKKSMQYVADGAVRAVFAPPSSGIPISTFKNNEKRIVTRDADGFISSVETIRNAQKVSDNAAT